jgi:pimeloyl-ACP methyl ester carboxylesterase
VRSTRVAVGPAEAVVREWGPDDGVPLLQLHALGPAASGALVGLMAAPLVERGVRILAPDGPGFGGSEPLPQPDDYAVPALAGRTWALADALGLDRVMLAGHSWGGAIACHMAATEPARVRALILLDSGHLDYRDVPGVDLDASLAEMSAQAEAARWRLADRAALEELLEIEDPARRERLADALLEGLRDDGEGGLVGAATGDVRGAVLFHLARSLQSETWPRIAAAGIPTLLLLATEPAEADAVNRVAGARFADAVATAEVVHVERATHGMMTDLEDALGEVVAEWLSAHDLI